MSFIKSQNLILDYILSIPPHRIDEVYDSTFNNPKYKGKRYNSVIRLSLKHSEIPNLKTKIKSFGRSLEGIKIVPRFYYGFEAVSIFCNFNDAAESIEFYELGI